MTAKPRKPTFPTTGNVPSSALSQLADLADYAANPPACIVTRLAVQSLTTGLAAQISFDTLNVDTASIFSTAVNLLPPAGIYQISGWVDIAANATGIRVLELTQNGSIVLSSATSAPSAGDGRLNLSGLFLVVDGDAFSLQAFQSSGGNLNVTAARLGLVRVSGT